MCQKLATSRYNTRWIEPASDADVAAQLALIEPAAVARVLPKATHRLVRIDQLEALAAMIVKQELLALDADALVSPQVYLGGPATCTDVLIFASLHRLGALAARLRALPLAPLQALADELDQLIAADGQADRGTLAVGGRQLAWGARTYVMGIVNVTPDSFSADGLLQADDPAAAAVAQARGFIDDGADLLDVGAESTRPGAQPVDAAEQIRRIVPVIRALAPLGRPISADAYLADVARAALDAGAHMINDIWGLRTPDGGWNDDLAALVRDRGAPIVLMHNRRAAATVDALGGRYDDVAYADLMGEIIAGLRERVAYALDRGIAPSQLIIDPGLGFGKTPQQNLTIMRRLRELRSLGLPLLIGASRKSFVGLPLGLPPTERDEGTAATTALATQGGADIVRAHNVRTTVRAARVADAICRV